MFKKYLILAAAASFALASCEKTPEPVYDPITMTEFALMAENNPALGEDIVVTPDQTTKAISIVLPYSVPTEALKSLVPSFTLSEAEGVAKVGEAEVVSGKTAVDFSNPVDIVVSTEHVNAMYTVTVTLEKPLAFAKFAESTTEIYADPKMAINPKTNEPYFISNLKAESTDGRFPVVLYLNGSSVDLYSTLVEGRSDMFALAFDPDGQAYASFIDYIAPTKQTLSVAKVTKGGATFLGGQGAIAKPNSSCFSGLAPVSSSEIWSFTSNNAAGTTVGKRALNLSKFDGSAWTQEIACGTRSTTEYTYQNIVKNIRGEWYALLVDYNNISVSLFKYDAGSKSWVDFPGIIKPIAADGATEITTADYTYGCLDFDVATNGEVYIALSADVFTAGTKEYAVVKYSPATKAVTIVGGGTVAPYLHSKSRAISLALDANDIPYVVVGNVLRTTEDGSAAEPCVITYLDTDTKVWTEPQPISPAVKTSGISIAFAEDGTGYVAYKDETTSKLVLYKTLSE